MESGWERPIILYEIIKNGVYERFLWQEEGDLVNRVQKRLYKTMPEQQNNRLDVVNKLRSER